MRAIEKLTGQKVERVLLPDFGGSLQIPVKKFAGNKKSGGGRRSFRAR
jgi:hypothetical protein